MHRRPRKALHNLASHNCVFRLRANPLPHIKKGWIACDFFFASQPLAASEVSTFSKQPPIWSMKRLRMPKDQAPTYKVYVQIGAFAQVLHEVLQLDLYFFSPDHSEYINRCESRGRRLGRCETRSQDANHALTGVAVHAIACQTGFGYISGVKSRFVRAWRT